jgi:uncharacterized protein (UPF0332 family)
MRFDGKAEENLEAAERLMPDDESGSAEAWPNAAASRAYYAAYLAVADVAQRRGIPFTSEDPDYYRHRTFPADATRWGILDEDSRDDLELLRNLRVKADYEEDHVDRHEATLAIGMARTLVRVLSDSKGSRNVD